MSLSVTASGAAEVILLPHAPWIRNETLFFEISRQAAAAAAKRKKKKPRSPMRRRGARVVMPTGRYVLGGAKIRGFDFADWLMRTVSRRDFVVVKMDVDGTLVDELFLRCRYGRSSYSQCR